MNLYAYCLSEYVTTRAIDSQSGVAGAPTFLLEHEGIATVVSRYCEEQIAVTRANVLAHERVVQRVLQAITPLPFRYGTIVTRARLESYLISQQSNLKAQLARVRDCVEMGVKIIWKQASTTHDVEHAEAGDNLPTVAATPGSGTAFLLQKQRELLGDHEMKARAEEVSQWLARSLGDAVRDARTSL